MIAYVNGFHIMTLLAFSALPLILLARRRVGSIGVDCTQRLGWDEAFRRMAEPGDDAPLFLELEDSFDAEWAW